VIYRARVTLRTPAVLTSFVGREREVADLSALLDAHRLVTVTGPGGAGKTRLALEATRRLAPDAAFADLNGVGAARLVSTLAAALGEDRAGLAIEDLSALVGDREGVLVVDGFEHLLDAAPALASLVVACPRLRMAVTSRAVLRVTGEHVFEVPPLAADEALELFTERASAAGTATPFGGADLDAAAAVCGLLGGLPLAIELAAARTRLLRPSDLLARLEHPLSTLVGGARDSPPRQQTLLATIEWSFGLLDEDPRRALVRLGVFEGAFTLDAADAVADDEDALQTLVDHHLLTPGAGSGGTPRYDLHPAVRAFARERLDEPDVFERHARFFLTVAEQAAGEIGTAEQVSWLDRLDADHDDLLAALRRWIEQAELEGALHLAAALKWYWFMRGDFALGRALLESALALEGEADRSAALDAAGWLAQAAGDVEAGERMGIQAVELARAAGDRVTLAWALNTLGFARARAGRDARAEFEEALALFRALEDTFGISFALSMLGFPLLTSNDPGAARVLVEESLALTRRLGDAQGAARALIMLGWIELELDDLGAAAARIAEILELSADLRHPYLIAYGVEEAAMLAAARDDPARAVRLAAAAGTLRERTRAVAAASLRTRFEERLEAARALPAAGAETARGRGLGIDAMLAEARRVAGTAPGTRVGAVTLTPREIEILRLVAEGLTDAAIARRLYVSVRTVNAHLRSIYTKLGVTSRAAATRIAAQRGLLRAPA
jgi:predicted ATPase/DNA-binding NarL/FixJ family response regulator